MTASHVEVVPVLGIPFIGGLLEGLVDNVIGQMLEWLFATTAGIIDFVLGLLLAGPRGFLEADSYVYLIGVMRTLGLLVLPILLLAGTLQLIVRQDVGRLVRLWLIDTPLTVGLMGFLLIASVTVLALSDEIADWLLVESAVNTFREVLTSPQGMAATVSSVANPAVAALVGMLCIFALLGLCMTWGVLVMRGVAVGIAVAAGPLMLAARLWPAAEPWFKRWMSLLIALFLIKPTLALTLSVALTMAGSGIDPSSGVLDVQSLAAGLIAIGISSLTPLALLKFVPQVTEAVSGRLATGFARGAGTAAGMAAAPVVLGAVSAAAAPLTAKFTAAATATGNGGNGVPLSPAARATTGPAVVSMPRPAGGVATAAPPQPAPSPPPPSPPAPPPRRRPRGDGGGG